VHFLFLHESGQPDDKAFAIGGAAIRVDEWSVLRDRWQRCLADHGWPHKEVKWHLIASA
jgi:hypothetical protein